MTTFGAGYTDRMIALQSGTRNVGRPFFQEAHEFIDSEETFEDSPIATGTSKGIKNRKATIFNRNVILSDDRER